jgi:hypothetical protein
MQLVAICNVAGCWMPTDQIARELPCLCVTVKIRGPSFLEAPARSLTSLPAVDGPEYCNAFKPVGRDMSTPN